MKTRFWVLRLLRWPARVLLASAALLFSYALLAYVLLPASWRLQNVPFATAPLSRVTYTAEGIPSDPLNIALVGTREEIVAAMRQAGWHQADAITFVSGWKDAQSVLLNRPYPTAPMSTQYVWNRPQDLAFEQAVGTSPRRRHHVRFWRMRSEPSGRTLWVGAATFDLYVGVSHFTGEVMHHIDPDVDAERDKVLADLSHTGRLGEVRTVAEFRPSGPGQNCAGDMYRSDGQLVIGTLR
jgi:hypothetical protein